MRMLEDRLDRASAELRRGVASMPKRPPSELSRRLSRRRTLSVTTVLVLVLGSFAGTALLLSGDTESVASQQSTAATTVPETASQCLEPPPAETESLIQDFPIAIDVETVLPGDQVELFVGAPQGAAPESMVVGLTTTWQCWNGSEWVDLFLLAKGPEGSGLEPLVQAVDSEATATGFYVPLRAAILIPNVPEGNYRIRERIHEDGGATYESHLIVEVRYHTRSRSVPRRS